MMFSSVLVVKNTFSTLALYVVGTCTLELPSLIFFAVIVFGDQKFCISSFDGIPGVASFNYCISFTLADALGSFFDVLLASTLGAVTCQTVDYVGIPSTEYLLRSVGSIVCMGYGLDFCHNIFVCFGSGVGSR